MQIIKQVNFNPNFKILDGLRGIAATYVVINHCRGNLLIGGTDLSKIIPFEEWSIGTKVYYSLLQLTALGREFVVFFFVLSGFSIAHSLSKNQSILSFLERRFIRLYPPYITALCWAALIFFLVQYFAPNQLTLSMKSVFYNFNYIFSNLLYFTKGDLVAPFWSLTHEVLFYLLIPIVFLLNVNYYFVISLLLYLSSFIFSSNETAGNNVLTQFLFDYNIFFVFGIILYKKFNQIKVSLILEERWFWIIISILVLCMIASKFILGVDNRISLQISALLSIIMIVNFLNYKYLNPLIEYLGKMSYTIYISHFASMYLFIIILDVLGYGFHTQITNWYVWIIGIFFCLFISIPLFYIAEYPSKLFLQKKRTRNQRTINEHPNK